ncbi:Coatomer subunit zeta-1 [Acorus calamus]|uniref:Coatomer subunit zeta n=1 Tax=Acorus calamus TaxID=4465 RepID=A0AAV9EXH0_ACOCL|nr:Coatomer subunit zeta-1 [Acorus calamus]
MGLGAYIFSDPLLVNLPGFTQESFPSIKNILLLDSEGKRVAVKYYSDDWSTLNAKLAFEKSVFAKTQKTNARTEDSYICGDGIKGKSYKNNNFEITMFDDYVVVYKFIQDLHFFVTGGSEENELILSSVLQGFCDAVGLLLRNSVDKRTALENLDLILLCIDEIVDGGIILETDGMRHCRKSCIQRNGRWSIPL